VEEKVGGEVAEKGKKQGGWTRKKFGQLKLTPGEKMMGETKNGS